MGISVAHSDDGRRSFFHCLFPFYSLQVFQALSTALASTVGMGNISGVAVAISMGGPGALFWMWISAFVGMSTKFFTCTLSIMFRGKDDLGQLVCLDQRQAAN